MPTQHSEMVLIAAGTFLMGSQERYINEHPIHEVELSAFYMDARVVTNREFQQFIQENPEWSKDRITPEMADQDYLNLWIDGRCPDELLDYSVINVSQVAAEAFARWIGKRLPTEAEWEYAAGGPERYTWSTSNAFDPEQYVCALDGNQPKGALPAQRKPNSWGLFDMCGLGWEWVQDRYEDDYYARSPRCNPLNGSLATEYSVLRGGCAYTDDPFYLRIYIRGRSFPQACHEDYGFRCARDA